MALYEIEIEFLKVLFIGLFIGFSAGRAVASGKINQLREIKHFKFFELNRPKRKIKGPNG